MSYQGNFRIPHMVRCGWCSAIINTANLDVEVTVPTVEVEPIGTSVYSPTKVELDQKLMKPHAMCPRCGHLLYVKEVKSSDKV